MDKQCATTKSWNQGLQMLWATQLVDDEVERAEIVKAAVDQFFADALKLRRYYQPHTLESFQRVVHAPPPE